MSPTSYQTAPPRTSIIVNAIAIVKLKSDENGSRFSAMRSNRARDGASRHQLRGPLVLLIEQSDDLRGQLEKLLEVCFRGSLFAELAPV
jgi:hypothetical protein